MKSATPIPGLSQKQFIRAENCSRCKYANLVNDGNNAAPLECRKGPMVAAVMVAPGQMQLHTVFARMTPDAWCHSWAPKFTMAGASEPVPVKVGS